MEDRTGREYNRDMAKFQNSARNRTNKQWFLCTWIGTANQQKLVDGRRQHDANHLQHSQPGGPAQDPGWLRWHDAVTMTKLVFYTVPVDRAYRCWKALRRELLREVTLLRSVVRPTSPIARREKVRAWSSWLVRLPIILECRQAWASNKFFWHNLFFYIVNKNRQKRNRFSYFYFWHGL